MKKIILFSIILMFTTNTSFGQKHYDPIDAVMFFKSSTPSKSVVKDRFIKNPKFLNDYYVKRITNIKISKSDKVDYFNFNSFYGDLMSTSYFTIDVTFTTYNWSTLTLKFIIPIFKDPRPRKVKGSYGGSTYEKGYFSNLKLDKNSIDLDKHNESTKYLEKEGDYTLYYRYKRFDNGMLQFVSIWDVNYRKYKTMEEQHIGYKNEFLKDGTQILTNGNGIHNDYYKNGNILMKSEHKKGSRDGTTTWYYPNGQIEESANYKYDKNSKPYGLRWEILSSFQKDGTVRPRGTLKNGNGTWIKYDNNGNKTGETVYRNGVKFDLKKTIKKYDNGNTKKIVYYDKNGDAQGEYKSYFENGNLKNIGNYKNSFAVGIWKYYSETKTELLDFTIDRDKNILTYFHSNGSIKSIGEFNPETGKNIGKHKTFYEDGQLESEGSYNEGKKTGEWKHFVPGITTQYMSKQWD